MAEEMITLRNKKTGQVVQVPRSQYTDKPQKSGTGVQGIVDDVSQSLDSAYGAGVDMLKSIPGGVKNIAKYATTNSPLETMGNLGAGVVEGGSELLSSPQVLARYLAEKFPSFGKFMDRGKMPGSKGIQDPTFYEALKKFEGEHGLAPQSEEEASVRNLGGLLSGGKIISKLPNMLARTGTIAAQSAGAGGDPVHAALLGVIGDMTARGVGKAIPKRQPVEPQAVDGLPELPPDDGGAGASAANPVFGTTPTASIPKTMNQPALNVTLGGLGYIPTLAKALAEGAKAVPEKVAKTAKAVPEALGKGTASVLETAADYGSKIPGAAEVLQPTMGALASYLKHISVAPEEMAQRKLFGDLTSKDLPQINERMEAAKRLGLSFLTPGEALLSPFQTAKEANIGKTSSGAKLLYEKGKERVGSEGQAINSLLDTVYDAKKLAPEKQAAYDETMGQTLPPDFMEKWKQNPIVDWALKQMESKPTYKSELKDVPKDSFEYWNIVKRVIGDLEKGEAKGMQGFSSNAATKVRNNMVDEMDQLQPRYEDARNIAEREFTRRDLEDVFDKKTMTLNNFWSFLKSDKAFNKVMRKLDAFPDAQQKLKDIRLLSNEIIPFDESIRTSYKLEKTGMTKDRNKLDALKRDLDERYGKEHDVAAVNLMTNPDWPALLAKFLKDKGK